jgi:arylsulfatase A-like enzyme
MSIYPTLLELLGLPERADVEGVSVVPLLENCALPWTVPALSTNGPNNHAIRRDNWSYIRHANGDEELYDRDSDRWEWRNLANDAQTAEQRAEFASSLPCKRYPVVGTLWCDKEN